MKRRSFLQGSAGLVLGFQLPGSLAKPVLYEPWQQNPAELNAWLVVSPDNQLTIRVAIPELGQGALTAMSMLIAEELEADWRLVRAEYVSLDRNGDAGVYGEMAAMNSESVRRSQPLLQRVGAEARERLIKAAAERWSVRPDDCYADYGRIYNNASGDSVSYGDVAVAAANLRVAGVTIKQPDDFGLIGLATPRLDIPAKVDGSAQYSIDVRLPGMVYAAVRHCPVVGGTVRSMKFNAIRNRDGVLRAVRMPSSVAVVAEHFWQASQAVEALPIEWRIDETSSRSHSAGYKAAFVAALPGSPDKVLEESGDVIQAMDDAETTIESDYVVPHLSQAPMEPMNCTVDPSDDRLEIWAGTQDPVAAVRAAAAVSGLSPEKITLHNCYSGGSFGRRRHVDYIEEAVRIARFVRQPVQMIWTREEEQRSGHYRPLAAMRFKAGFDLNRKLIAYTSHSITEPLQGEPEAALEGLAVLPFRVANRWIAHSTRQTHVTTGYWRSRGHSQNAFATECFFDEMAVAAAKDPMDYRRTMLQEQRDIINVLESLRDRGEWGRRMVHGSAQGLAVHRCFGSVCGIVAEVAVSGSGELSVDRLIAVVDCGNVVDPALALAQVESGLLFGLSAALYGKLTIDNGVVLEDNYDTYQMARLTETPEMEVHLLTDGGEHWGGLGTVAVPPVAPALCNALYRITGRRIRELPISDYLLARR